MNSFNEKVAQAAWDMDIGAVQGLRAHLVNSGASQQRVWRTAFVSKAQQHDDARLGPHIPVRCGVQRLAAPVRRQHACVSRGNRSVAAPWTALR